MDKREDSMTRTDECPTRVLLIDLEDAILGKEW